MNKLIKRLAILMSLCTVFMLTACDKTDYEKPTIEVTVAHALRTTIEFDFIIWDEDEALVDLKVTLTGEHDGEEYIDTKNISIYGGSYEEDEETGEEEFVGEEKTNTFTGLQVDHTYEITMTGTYGEKSRSMIDKITLTTSTKGSAEEPHQITTVEDLEEVRLDTDGYFELMNSIDLKDEDGEKTELKPFFTSSKKFDGNFQGNGFTISNFYQDSFDQDLGLFGYIGSEGVVNNLNIENVSLNSTRYTSVNIGAFAGTNLGTVTGVAVKNVEISTKGPDTGDQFVGGFVGANKDGGTITNCTIDNVSIALNVPSNARVGGFVGTNISSTKVSTLNNVAVSKAKVLVQIASENGYNLDDEDVEVVLNVGGFIGDNRGFINTASTDATIGVYTDNSRTDLYFAGEEVNAETNLDKKYGEYEQTNRHIAIEKINLNIGGFAGANLTGSINNGVTTTNEIKVEVPFLNYIRFGGFVGFNDSMASLRDCEYVGNGTNYELVVDIDTILNGSVNGNTVVYVGHIVGLNNNGNLSSGCVDDRTTGDPAQFVIVTRETKENPDYVEPNESDDSSEDGDSTEPEVVIPEFLYEFVKVNLDINGVLK